MDDAWEEHCDGLEATVINRGQYGWDEPVFWKGKVVGHIRRFDNKLLLRALEAKRPEKWKRTAYSPPQTADGAEAAAEQKVRRVVFIDRDEEDGGSATGSADAD